MNAELFRLIATHCEQVLNLNDAALEDEDFYQSIPLCVIDAVFSIGVRYDSTKSVVDRYCKYYALEKIRNNGAEYPPATEQESNSSFIGKCEVLGSERMAEEVFQNRQRTSTSNGILKSEAVYRFACVLRNHKVEYYQDLAQVYGNEKFEEAIRHRHIPGQGSGISL